MKHLKPYSAIFLGLLLWGGASQAADDHLEKMKKDLMILTKIIQTSFGVDDGDWRRSSRDQATLKPRQIEPLYLQGLGVILKVRFGIGGVTGLGLLEFAPSVDIPVEPFVPLAPLPGSDDASPVVWEHFQENLDFMTAEAEMAVEEASHLLTEAGFGSSEELREQMQKLKREQRARLKEYRERARETRKSLREKDALSEQEREQLLANVKRQQEQFKQNMESYLSRVRELHTRQNEEWQGRLNGFETALIDLLCEYGGSLRALPDNQTVTIILDNVERGDNKTKDRIYIFKKSDLLACRDGRITKEALKNQSTSYTF